MKIASVAIIGISGFGSVHYRDLIREVGIGRATASAATVINPDLEPEKVAELKSLGCEIFSDYEQMLDKWHGKLDLCMIPCGIHWHKPMTIAALEAGANVFVEKPAASTVQDVDEMIAAETKAKKFVAVGYQQNYSRQFERVKETILSGKIGKLKEIRCAGLWPRTEQYYSRNNWAGKLKVKQEWILDSPFHNAFAHWLMLMCSLAGTKPYETALPISVNAELYRAKQIESCDTCSLRVETSSGVPLVMYVSHSVANSGYQDPLLVIQGTKGEIQWPAYQHADIEGEHPGTVPFDGHGPLREAVFDAIFRKIRDPKAPICGLSDARVQVVIANGAFESGPIQVIPPGHLRTVAHDESSLLVISNLESLVREAMKKGQLFSELGVPWAKPAKTISLEGYRAFGGLPT